MIEKAQREDETRAKVSGFRRLSRWTLPGILALATVAALIALSAAGPYLFKGATLQGELAAQLRATTGLAFKGTEPGRFDLLPAPHVVFLKSHISDRTGALSIETDGLDGYVRLLPLIVGRIELASLTLNRPRLAIDLDARPMAPDSLIGRTLHPAETDQTAGTQRLGIVTLEDGSATIKGKALRGPLDLRGIDLTLDWRDLDSPATLTGSLRMGETDAEIAAWAAQPSSLMRGDHSAVAFQIRSAPIDLSGNGDLVNGATKTFRGHVNVKAAAAQAVLDLLGEDVSLLAPFDNLSLNSDVSVGVDGKAQASIDLPNLKFRADGNAYEGTLAFQTGARPMLSGTLATEQLMLAPFLHRIPKLSDAAHHWSSEPILAKQPRLLDLDLRISATHMRLAPLVLDDVALAVMTRSDRTEVALVEGKAYGGTAKGRFSVGVSEEGISLRGAGALTDADASTLTWDAFGRQLAAGTLSGSLNLETAGDSPAALMSNLQGWAKGTVRDGEISGVDIGRCLRDARRNRPQAMLAALHSGRTAFQSLAFSTQIYGGLASFDEGAVKGEDAAVSIEGNADLGARTLDLHAAATPAGAASTTPALRFDIKGSIEKPAVQPDLSSIRAAPAP